MNILNLAFQLEVSKKLPRTGWLMNGIKNPESVAEHCFRVTVLAMVLAPILKVDQKKLLKMAIIHDIGETASGDLVVERGKHTDKKEKSMKEKMEKEAIRYILYGYEEDYSKLFQEMLNRKSKEALFFWEIDKLEMAIQAYEYEKKYKKDLTEFFENSMTHIKSPIIKPIMDDLLELRKGKKVFNSILDLSFQVGISKNILRTGWVKRKVKNPESVAEHCFRVVVMCLVLAEQLKTDQLKLIKMGIIHDLGETSTGDLVVESWRKVFVKQRDVKEKMEKEAVKNIFAPFGDSYLQLFEEMIERKTLESNVFWDIDVFERTIQAYEYERDQDRNFLEFFENADERIKHPLIRNFLKNLQNMRK